TTSTARGEKMSAPSIQVIRHGSETPPPESQILRAGPLSVLLEGGDLRYARLGDREILRRVYVAVRDHNWNTIAGVLANRRIEQDASGFRVSFDCVHQQGEIDFAWRGTLSGDATGTIRFGMEGEAHSTFRRNRIGICVLHPIVECAGQPYRVEKIDGSVESGIFPRSIAPSQPVIDFQALFYDVQPGVTAEIRFTGDTFEMEDQRNWTDASFKTYSTPLRLPIPVEVAAGTRISQSITVRLHSSSQIPSSDTPTELTFRIGERATTTLPRLGLGLASHGQLPSAREVQRLRALKLSHLRVDLRLADANVEEQLRRSVTQARQLGVPIEAAIFLTDAAAEELSAFRASLDQLRPEIAAWLIFHVAEKSTSERWLRLVRERLGSYAPDIPLAAGTNVYFTELNRGRPPVEALDLVCYSLNPQVHAFDDRSLIETLPAQGWTIESARRFAGGKPIAISPITLKPRFNPDASGPEPAVGPTGLPPSVDTRQMSLFGAAWTVGSLKSIAEAGVDRVTYYETTGWRGVMETEDGSAIPDRFRSIPGSVFPLYHVLADVGELAGGQVIPTVTSDPLRIDGLAVRQGDQIRILLANLSPDEQTVQIENLNGASVSARILDERTALDAMTDPENFRAAPPQVFTVSNGRLTLTLRPYAIATIDQSC
ncbi:MAG TPA: hypothetical protein VMW65_18325, partial [Chloroflexota bacterium]|nr:hypothetical protein [Chloroflexota bacterium]